jgi:1-aminocyclopropane-1-carboxylate deaminase/D-cysteine desulfhydrase-like pyridoxal-dependent ACC family enzyme
MMIDLEQIRNPEPSPLVQLPDERWSARGLELWIKRDDILAPTLNDPFCGNKWRKLQHNLLHAGQQGYNTLLTFGGAYSNHIAAVAAAGQHLGLATIGIIRGEEVENPCLERAQAQGMQLHFMDRTHYRQKHTTAVKDELVRQFGPCYLIPEGGTNALALKGCAVLGEEILAQRNNPTHIALACGTGGTLAGVIAGLNGKCTALGVSVLKGDFMERTVRELLQRYTQKDWPYWSVAESFHHGGYAKKSKVLDAYIQDFYQQHGVLLEPIYTAKLFYALEQLMLQDYFPRGSRVVGVHTGGLQAFACQL